nr:hypothetical protein [Oscillochloris trichoides]
MILVPSDWITIIGLFVTSVAFIAGLFQYRQAQRWKALEFISGEMKEFISSRDVQNAIFMLEANRRPITFVTQFINKVDGDERLVTVVVSDEMILSTLTYYLQNRSITKEEGLIRDTFNTFFFYLSNFNHYIQVFGLIKYSDLHPYLGYWLEILSEETDRKPSNFPEVIQNYLKIRRYDGVRQLIGHYKAYCAKHPAQRSQQKLYEPIDLKTDVITKTNDKNKSV